MFDALYIGATGMRASQSQVDTIAQNVANLNTVGYRRSAVSFSEVSAAVMPTGTDPILEAARASLATRGAGALANVALATGAGDLKETGQKLDVAIDGAGFLEVVRPDGSLAYTRAGSLKLSADGVLTLADGTPLASRLEFPPDTQDITIGTDGKVTATVGADSQPLEIGQLDLVTFANPAGLQAVGGSQFVATAESGAARAGAPSQDGRGILRQGFLEGSNVQLVEELVSMMVAQRAFELNGRVIQAADQMMAITNGLYRS
jgi:flagellar basal-body rod protein FlgG